MAFSYLEALDPYTSELNSAIVYQRDLTEVTLADMFQRKMHLLFAHRFSNDVQEPLMNLYKQRPQTAQDFLTLSAGIELEGQILVQNKLKLGKMFCEKFPDYNRPDILDICEEAEENAVISYDRDDVHLLMYHCLYGGMNQYLKVLQRRKKANTTLQRGLMESRFERGRSHAPSRETH